MKTKFVWILVLSLIFSSCNLLKKSESQKMGKKVTLETQTQKFSYALGLSIGDNLKASSLDTIDVDLLVRGINDNIQNREKLISTEEAAIVVQQYIANLEERKTDINKEVEKKFFEQNKKREGVIELESGLQYEIIKEGEGAKPTIVDQVSVHYHGTLIDGSVFDSSIEREEPMTFPVNSVIPGMQEALLLMSVGSKWKIYVPSHLAYGESGAGGVIEPYSPLIFDVELINIE